MRSLFLFAAVLLLAACGSDTAADAPVAPAPVAVDAVPADAPMDDATADDALPMDEIDPSDAYAADDPMPAAPSDAVPAAPRTADVAGSGLGIANGTGMVLVTLHIAGCNESEGADWAEMADWATDYLGDEVLMAGDTVELELAPGCYVMLPTWEDGTSAMERIEATAGMTHVLTLG